MWAMMLISILLILHVQRDRYIEALRWHGGIVDHGPPLAWEVQPIVLSNDTYEATFLAPSLRRASTFVKLEAGAPMAVNGLASTVFSSNSSSANASHQVVFSSGVSSLVVGSSSLRGACSAAYSSAPCFVAVQRAPRVDSSTDPPSPDTGKSPPSLSGLSCHRFVAGASVEALAPLSLQSALCVKSQQIYAAMATGNLGSCRTKFYIPMDTWAQYP